VALLSSLDSSQSQLHILYKIDVIYMGGDGFNWWLCCVARFVELIVVVTHDSCARQSRTAAHANLGCAQLNLAVADLVGHIRIRLKVRGFTRGHSGFNGHGSFGLQPPHRLCSHTAHNYHPPPLP
jgi:hypothetical protein